MGGSSSATSTPSPPPRGAGTALGGSADPPRDRIPTYADLGQLSYTHSVVEETLRLYSPAYQTMRQCVVPWDMIDARTAEYVEHEAALLAEFDTEPSAPTSKACARGSGATSTGRGRRTATAKVPRTSTRAVTSSRA